MSLKFLLSALLVAASSASFAPPAAAQSISLKPGETAELHSVYWIENCRSILTSFAGVEVLEGPPGVTLSLREQQVRARRQNCPEPVRGAMVVATVKEVAAKSSGTLKYRVKYNTEDGQKQSSHTYKVELFPGQ